jgi:hypothetical protein
MTARTGQARLLTFAGAGAVAVALVGAGLHFSAGSADESSTVGLSAATTSTVTVNCPDVAGKIGAVPAASQSGVTAELANLQTQIANVDARLAREPGQADNQLNDLKGKRSAVIDRIILDITRQGGTEPAGLRALDACTLGSGSAAGSATTAPSVVATVSAGDAAATAQTVNCPDVAGKLPDIPAGAQAEVTRNLDLLNTQIAEADARLAKIAVKPEGGPAFIQNAILGPLKDKRVATINRIETAIDRITKADKLGLADTLSTCGLNAAGSGAGSAATTTTAAAATTTAPAAATTTAAAASGVAQTVNCPDVAALLPDIPAGAQAEVTRNLDLLNTQIAEADARLAKIAVKPEGGPAFIQNAILGPLADKRASTIDRINLAISRITKVDGADLSGLATCTLNG